MKALFKILIVGFLLTYQPLFSEQGSNEFKKI